MKSIKKVILSGLVLSTMALSNQASAIEKVGEWSSVVHGVIGYSLLKGASDYKTSIGLIDDIKEKRFLFYVNATKIVQNKFHEKRFDTVIYINDKPIKASYICGKSGNVNACYEVTGSDAAYEYITKELKKGEIKVEETYLFPETSIGNRGFLNALANAKKEIKIIEKAL